LSLITLGRHFYNFGIICQIYTFLAQFASEQVQEDSVLNISDVLDS